MTDNTELTETYRQALADAESLSQIDTSTIKSIAQLAQHQATLEDLKAKMESMLKDINKSLDQVRDKDLSNLMIEAGTKSFELEDGTKLKVSKVYLPSINADDKPKVYRWMEEQGHGSLITASTHIPCGKGGWSEAEEYRKKIVEAIPSLDNVIEIQGDVHWQTLRAFVREQLEAGKAKELPAELKVLELDRVKVTLPKKKSPKKEAE